MREEMGKDDSGASGGAEPSARDGQVERLANALRRYREAPPMPSDATAPLGWHDLTRWSFAEAGIDLTEEQFTRAWKCLWQSAFQGGNYTLDAKRVLAAAFGRGETA